MTFARAHVYVSADGVEWVDLSGHGASVAVGGGEREVGEQLTFGADTPIVKGGARNAVELTVKYIYTEEEGDPFLLLEEQHTDNYGELYCQYQAKDDGLWYKTGAGILVKPGYPQGEPSGDVVLSEFAMKCAELAKDTVSD